MPAYSLEGKVNGTTMIYDALCSHLGISPEWEPELPAVENNVINVDSDKSQDKQLFDLFNQVYPISDDDELMRKTLTDQKDNVGPYFDSLRKNYRLRRELNNYSSDPAGLNDSLKQILSELRVQF